MVNGKKAPASRMRWGAEEAGRVLDEWRASGLSLAAFARERGLVFERVRRWRQRLGYLQGTKTEGLVPAVVTGTGRSFTFGDAGVTVRAPGGVVIEIADPGAVPARWLSAVVGGMTRAGA